MWTGVGALESPFLSTLMEKENGRAGDEGDEGPTFKETSKKNKKAGSQPSTPPLPLLWTLDRALGSMFKGRLVTAPEKQAAVLAGRPAAWGQQGQGRALLLWQMRETQWPPPVWT